MIIARRRGDRNGPTRLPRYAHGGCRGPSVYKDKSLGGYLGAWRLC